MSAKLLLYVSPQRTTAALWRGGTLAEIVGLGAGAAGLSEAGQLLAAHPGVPVYLLTDCVEEDYRSESLPHVRGRAAQEMLARRLKQVFRNAPFCAAWYQGRESDKRKDDKFLFVALTMPELLRPWLDMVQTQGHPLAGIYSLPMVTQTLVGKLRLQAPHLLVVSVGSGGLRQSYFQDGQLKISRLTPLDIPSEVSRRAYYADEIDKTRLFLASQRYLTRDERLHVALLDTGEPAFAELGNALGADSGFSCSSVPCAQISAALKVDRATLCLSPDVMHLYALGLQAPPVSLAPPELSRGFRLLRLSRAVYTASLAVLVAGIGWGGINLYRQQLTQDEIVATAAVIRQHETLYQRIARQFPRTPTSAENLQRTVELAKVLQNQSRDPERLMAVVSHALDANKDVALTQLRWLRDGTQGGDAAERDRSAAAPAVAALGEVGYLDGEITSFLGDYRAAVGSIESFAASLRADRAVASVDLLRQPLNVDPSASLSGSTQSGTGAPGSAAFKLKIVLRAGT